MTELPPIDENYCMLIVDRGLKKKEAYKISTGKNHKSERALDGAVCRFHNRPEIKARIKELQAEIHQVRRESIKETLRKIPYDKKNAFDDYQTMYLIALNKRNAKAGVQAVDSIVKLLGLAEQTEGEVVFKILKEGQKKDAPESNNDST